MPESDQTKLTREPVILGGFILGALLIRAGLMLFNPMVGDDELYYIELGKSLYSGRGYITFFGVHQNMGQPLAPLVYGLATRWFSDPALGPRILALLIGVLGVLPFCAICRRIMSKTEALWSGALFLLAPFMIISGLYAKTESLFISSMLASLWALVKMESSPNALWPMLSAVFLWLAYMTRVEAIVLYMMVVLLLVMRSGRYGLKRVLVFALTFLILCAPYWLWLRSKAGFWCVTWAGESGALSFVSKRAIQDTKHSLKLFHPGLDGLPPSLYIVKNYVFNLYRVYLEMLPRLLPLLPLFLALIGFRRVLKRKISECRIIVWILVFAAFPIVFYPIVSLHRRFFYLTGALMLLFVGPGIVWAQAGVQRVQRQRFARGPVIAVLAACILLANFGYGYAGMLHTMLRRPLEQKRAGEWIEKNYDRPLNVAAARAFTCFYAGDACGSYLRLHLAARAVRAGESFKQFLKSEKIDLVLVDDRFMAKEWPELGGISALANDESFKPLQEFQYGKHKAILYEVG